MVNYASQRKSKNITERDVERLKKQIQPGDYVLAEVEMEKEDGRGRIRVETEIRKEIVIAKYPNLVMITGTGTRIHTATYKQIAVNCWNERK